MSGDAFQVGAIGLRTQQKALDGIASNIANVNTPAFKRTQLRFADMVAARSGTGNAEDTAAETIATVALDARLMLDAQGEVQRTGEPLDLAIEGRGFIELMGPGGRTLLWRGGGLKVNEDGMLASANGLALRASITVPQDATSLVIGRDGVVRATVPDNAEPIEIGQVSLVQIDGADGLERLDGGLYMVREGTVLNELQPGEDGAGQLVQGAIERSNVALTDEMVQLMLVQRAFAANAQIVQAADQMMAVANGLRR